MNGFDSILVANRGEIAVRVVRTARALGYRTIAVYSEADREAPHVRMADEAFPIGPSPSSESYLNIARVVDAARQSGAGAVHPGYGFLSESAEFVRACEEAELVFIGPSADAVELMGNKAAAKLRMIEAGVPCVPGYEGDDQTDEAMISAAHSVGFPIMVKAAAGGGGRGMRMVAEAADLPAALAAARSEALNAFGSAELILERAILESRHVEIQVFADCHGNVVHLGERDCSLQRRHQKVIEEAPCPVLDDDLRARMGTAAVEAARSIDYRGAGTVEFLLQADSSFHFLEMNTRLQVEHPVTELVTGLDLVALQIDVAAGKPLPFSQCEVRLHGHAIEARLYAEDPARDFLPSTGRVSLWTPMEGDGVRTDAGIESGSEISPYYDPMLAKVIAWGEDREIARRKLMRALKNTVLFGVTTNRSFLVRLLAHERFAAGAATTAMIAQSMPAAELAGPSATGGQAAAAAVLLYVHERDRARHQSANLSLPLLDWHSGGQLSSRYRFDFPEAEFDLLVSPQSDGGYVVRDGNDDWQVQIVSHSDGRARLRVDGQMTDVLWHVSGRGRLNLSIDGSDFAFLDGLASTLAPERASGGGLVVAPMHGALVKVLVRPGDVVSAGTRLAVLEAMKMQHDILAEIDGTVREVRADAGSQVSARDMLFAIEAD